MHSGTGEFEGIYSFIPEINPRFQLKEATFLSRLLRM